jgi:hypothetical protein
MYLEVLTMMQKVMIRVFQTFNPIDVMSFCVPPSMMVSLLSELLPDTRFTIIVL